MDSASRSAALLHGVVLAERGNRPEDDVVHQ